MRQPSRPKSPATPSRPRSLYARHGLAASVVLLCVLLCAVLWTGLFMLADYERDRIIESKRHENANLARVFEEHVARTIRAAELTLGEMANEYRNHGAKFDLVQYAKIRGIALDPYTGLSIVNEKGDRILASFPVPPGTLNLSTTPDYQYLARHDTPAIYISGPRLGVATGKWTVFLSLRINKPDRSFAGYAVVGMDPTYFSRTYADLDLDKDAIVVVVGIDGIVRVRAAGPNVTAGQNVIDAEVFRLLQATNHGSVVAPSMLDQVTRIFSYRTLKDYPLAVVIGTSQTAALSAHVNRMSIYLRVAGAVTAALLGLGLFALVQIRRKERANEALRVSEEKFAKAFDGSPDSITLVTLDNGTFVEVNDSFERFTGYSRAEAIGRNAADLKLWANPAQRDYLFAELRAGRTVSDLEAVIRRKDGGMRVGVRFSAKVEIDGVPHALSIMRDITETKRAEATSQRERAFAADLIQAAPAIMVLLDLEARIQHVNPYFEKLSGYRLDEVRGKEWFATFLPERDHERIRAVFSTTVHETQTRGNINPIVTRGGEEREIEWNNQVVRDDKGMITGVLAIGQDVTERQRAEQVERDSRRRLQSILDSLFARVGLFTLEGVVIEANRALVEVAGQKRENVIGKPLWDAYWWSYSPESQQRVREALRRAAQGETVRDDFRVRLAENVFITIDATFGPVRDEQGRVTNLVGSSVDITERRRAEETVRKLNAELEQRVRERTTKLEAANKELETFGYSVAHDLRAPLRGIDGYSRLLQADYADKLDDEGRGFLQNIVLAAKRMSELIDDLLAYSHIEHRDMQLVKVDPRALIESLLADRADEIGARGVTVSVAVACPSVTADREGLAMALRNLLQNALKFTRDVAHPAIEVGGREQEDGARLLWVRDNGPGFDMKFHDRIFAIFQRLHRMEDYPGTGIGLPIVKRAMERMGGRAWAESVPGKGATFFLEVPE